MPRWTAFGELHPRALCSCSRLRATLIWFPVSGRSPLLFVILYALLVVPNAAPAQEVPLVEKSLAQLSDPPLSPVGIKALAIRPAAWLHAETPHFILHYRRITEARRVALEIDFHVTYVAKVLNAGPERYARKSHVYIFEDEKDWKSFLPEVPQPAWVASFARGDELYLNVRDSHTGIFDSQILAHETTHAIVARLYPGKHWPTWLGEGFAEQMSGASTGARMGQYNQRLLQHYQLATLPLDKLVTTTEYPEDTKAVAQLYQSSEKLIRFLMTKHPPDRFPKFVDSILDDEPFSTAVVKVYGDRYKDYATFAKDYARLAQ